MSADLNTVPAGDSAVRVDQAGDRDLGTTRSSHQSMGTGNGSTTKALNLNDAIEFFGNFEWDGMIGRHRLSFIVAALYFLFAMALWDRAPVAPEAVPSTFDKPDSIPVPFAEAIEPLTRASVLAQKPVQAQGGSSKKGQRRPVLVRRDLVKELDEEKKTPPLEDAIGVLEQALDFVASPDAVGNNSEFRVGSQRFEIYGALGGVHTSRKQYGQAVGALEHAVVEALNIGDAHAVARGRLQLGHAHLNRHHYSISEGQFLKALNTSMLTEDAVMAAHCGAGWVLVMQGQDYSAKDHLLLALQQEGNRSSLREHCGAQGDGLDSYRALALAGLSIVEARDPDVEGKADRADELYECAARVLRHARTPGLGDPAARQHAQHAVGIAEIELGHMALAVRRYTVELQQQKCQFAGLQAATTPRHSFCMHDVQLASPCPQTALHLALAHFAALEIEAGTARINQLIDGIAGFSAVGVADWLLRFALAHLDFPGGRQLAAFLKDHIASWLPSADSAEEAFGDFPRAGPQEGQDVAPSAESSNAAAGATVDVNEVAANFRNLAAQLGDTGVVM